LRVKKAFDLAHFLSYSKKTTKFLNLKKKFQEKTEKNAWEP